MERERMSTKEAAEVLGISPQYLRDLMDKKQIDIGIVRRGKPNQLGSRRNTYLIYRKKVEKLVGTI